MSDDTDYRPAQDTCALNPLIWLLRIASINSGRPYMLVWGSHAPYIVNGIARLVDVGRHCGYPGASRYGRALR